MSRLLGLVIFVVGVVLLVFGISATDSVSSDISRFFSGKPTDKAIWLLVSGIVGVIVGAGGILFPRSHPA
ncbi:MAG TPA: DUF3185 family protein [Planctomycetota bacterium]|nr:DUF3185 family protein [Planctomycetota bacterium]